MEMTSYEPGTPSWVDLGTPDPAAASAFYADLFGWDIEEGPPEAGGYRMCMLKGKPVAGLGPQMNADMPPWWTTYITVADADATAAAVRDAGGTVMVEPFDVMDVGRMAVCTDTVGAVFSVWQPRLHIGAGLVNEAGTLTWNELATRQTDEAISFYAQVFGWKADTQEMGPTTYTVWQLNDRSIGGLVTMDENWPAEVPSHWMVYFGAENCDATAAKVTELGGTVSVPPTDIPVGRFAVCNDPQGATFSLFEMPAEG